MNKWISSEGGDTSDTQSSRSTSPTSNHIGSINSRSNTQSQIISKISTMEATHLDELHELSAQYTEDARNKDMQLQQSQNRVTAVERRIRERDAQMTTLKEEKAGFVRQVSDLKDQLYQLQFEVEETTSDKTTAAHEYQSQLTDAQRESVDAKRALDEALKSQVDAVTKAGAYEQENNELKKQFHADQGTFGQAASELAKLQQQLAELQTTNTSLTTQIAEEKANSTKNKQLNSKEISNLRSMLRSRDDAIQSLQGRVEEGQGEMTALEAELDGLKGEKHSLQGGQDDALDTLRKDNEEMKELVDKQNQALKNMTNKYDEQKKESDKQTSLLKQRGEEIELLESQLHEGECEKEASFHRSNSLSEQNHTRVTALEVELQTINEKADELTSSLNEAMEEIEDLQADVVFKEGKIASLEKEIEEASSLLKTTNEDDASQQEPPSPGRRESGNFARLRQEIVRVTRERAQLESDHARQLSMLKTSKDGDISKIEKELQEVCSQLKKSSDAATTLKASLDKVETTRAGLKQELDKTHQVMDQLDAEEDHELEDMKQKVEELQTSNDKLKFEIEDLTVKLKDKERELDEAEASVDGELREARQALIALDEERKSVDGSDNIKDLNDQLVECKEQIAKGEAKLNRTVRENDLALSDLRSELSSKAKYAEDLKDELESLQLSVERGPSKRNYGMAIDPEWHEPDTVGKLKVQVSNLSKEKRMIEHELRSKIDARDATIATLVLSASNQESNIAELKSEMHELQKFVDIKSSSKNTTSEEMKELDVNRRKEMGRLKGRTHDLTIELKQTKRKLLSVTEELEGATAQLAETDARPDVQDLAGRLVISEQAQKMLKTENVDKLKERDAAIANLLQSMQANEGVIANLRVDVESFKAKCNESVEENRRLQHESEIFAAQIIDQDDEFENINDRLKEKSSEIALLKREIASSSADVRNVKNLERQLDELKEDKRSNVSRINQLEAELRDVDMKKAEEVGFKVERLKIELQNAIDDKKATEETLNQQIGSLRKLRNHAMEDFESKLHQRDSQISSLEKELIELRENDFDDIFIGDDKPGGGQSKKKLLEERDMLVAKIEVLGEEIESLRSSRDSDGLSQLKTKLSNAEKLMEELEVDHEVVTASKEKELDRLHKQLSEAKEAQSVRELEQLSLLKKLESENEDIREEFTIRIREKNAKIVALEQTLSAQEQVVGNMSSEMDQLQNGMEKISVQRRAEIEEMQQELMDYTQKATRLEREVMSLGMKYDDKKLKHKSEIAKLKDRITNLESETPLERMVRTDKHDDRRESELAEKYDHVKWLNRSLKDENHNLKEKVTYWKTTAKDAKREESPPATKSAKNNDKWRNVALQEQVAVLSQRVIELEEEAATSVAQSRRPPQSPVMRSSLEAGGSTARSSSAPKSALRVSSYENQANSDLLSISDDDERGSTSDRAPLPSLPRPTRHSVPNTVSPDKPRRSSSRFSLRRKSSKERAPATPNTTSSGSTANYDF